MSFATAFYISLNQLSPEQLDHRMGLGGLDLIEPAVFLNMLRIIVIAKNLKEWQDWPTELVIPKLIHINAIQRLATQTDLVKIQMALSTPAQQYLSGISQGEKHPITTEQLGIIYRQKQLHRHQWFLNLWETDLFLILNQFFNQCLP